MLRIMSDLQAISRFAARRICEVARCSVRKHRKFIWVLSGGNTPVATYKILASEPYRNCELWATTHVYWGDERWVAPDRPESNYGTAKSSMLDFVAIPRGQIHPIATEMKTPVDAARSYEKIFPPQSDLLMLGMGADGHTASLFPHSPALEEARRLLAVSQAPAEPRVRITITAAGIKSARNILVMASGRDKAEALRRVFAPEGSIGETPARLAREAVWLVDRLAASKINPTEMGAVTEEE